jgi:uncharacterized protein YkwD
MKHSFRHWFVPHWGNKHHPYIVRTGGMAAVLVLVVLLSVAMQKVVPFALQQQGTYGAVLAASLVDYANQDRSAAGLSTLTTSPALTHAATLKAQDMATRGYFAHNDPQGREPWHWLYEAGYSFDYAGENLATDFTESRDVAVAWMQSPAHKENIVNIDYTEIGIGTAEGLYEGHPTTFVVQFFGKPKIAGGAESSRAPLVKKVTSVRIVSELPKNTNTQPSLGKVLGTEKQPATRTVLSTPTSLDVLGALATVPTSAQIATSPSYVVRAFAISLSLALSLLALLYMTHRATRKKYQVHTVSLVGIGALVTLFIVATVPGTVALLF